MAMRLAAILLVVLAIGALASWGAVEHARASRFKVFTVEVSEAGFNPQVCQISRDNYIQFKNVGTTPRRVIRPGSGDALTFDSGVLAPGAVSSQDFFPHGGTVRFVDAARPEAYLLVLLPVFSPQWDEICTPKPPGGRVVMPALARD